MPFDVAIHTYNRAVLLPKTLDSVLVQTVPAARIVVVDDGSKDETEPAVAAYGKRVEYQKIQNVGPGASRHAAIVACRGDWIACCDDDDLWLPNHLAELQAVIDRADGVDFVFSNFKLFRDETIDDESKFDQAPPGWWAAAAPGDEIRIFDRNAYRHFLAFNPIFPSCIAIRREFYDRIGGSDLAVSREKSEDAELTRRCVLYGRGACTSRSTVLIRRHADNYSSNAALNLLGKASVLQRHVSQGIVPAHFLRDTQATIDQSLLKAFRMAYWNNDFSTMLLAYRLLSKSKLTFRDYARLLLVRLRSLFG